MNRLMRAPQLALPVAITAMAFLAGCEPAADSGSDLSSLGSGQGRQPPGGGTSNTSNQRPAGVDQACADLRDQILACHQGLPSQCGQARQDAHDCTVAAQNQCQGFAATLRQCLATGQGDCAAERRNLHRCEQSVPSCDRLINVARQCLASCEPLEERLRAHCAPPPANPRPQPPARTCRLLRAAFEACVDDFGPPSPPPAQPPVCEAEHTALRACAAGGDLSLCDAERIALGDCQSANQPAPPAPACEPEQQAFDACRAGGDLSLCGAERQALGDCLSQSPASTQRPPHGRPAGRCAIIRVAAAHFCAAPAGP